MLYGVNRMKRKRVKTELIALRLRREEKKELLLLSYLSNTSVSEYIRRKIFNKD
jgi:hypothetical protein